MKERQMRRKLCSCVGKANDDLRSSTEQMLNSVEELKAQIATEFEHMPSIVWARHLWLHAALCRCLHV